MKTILRRLKEPSTWAGLGVIAGAMLPLVGVPLATVSAVVTALGGLAVLVREEPKP